MTKKTYLQPIVAEHRIHVAQQLLTSSPLTFSEDNTEGTGSFGQEDATGAAMGRHRSIWDDDE